MTTDFEYLAQRVVALGEDPLLADNAKVVSVVELAKRLLEAHGRELQSPRTSFLLRRQAG